MADLTQAQASRLFLYDKETGELFWKSRPATDFKTVGWHQRWEREFAGKPAGCVSPNGYRVVKFAGKVYRAHRVAWIIVHGEVPDTIDHINGDPLDNRFGNLRSVTATQNSRNRKLDRRNKSGVSGVSWDEKAQAWRACVRIDGVYRTIAQSKNKAAVIKRRRQFEATLGYHRNHGRAA